MDYTFSYDGASDEIILTSIGGDFGEGAYAIAVSDAGVTSAIRDLASTGNTMGSAAFHVTIDTNGPRVTAGAPAPGSYLDTAPAEVAFDFDEEIDWSTISTADILLTGPNGVTMIDGFDTPTGTRLVVHVSETTAGRYTMTVGPNLTDLAGNAMNQNSVSPNGDASADAFSVDWVVNPQKT
ncbi:MAG: Ig-like domain-containing protein, partial [Planctomycetes bacterium]|nr:Ig-like domain-containing protein [Planctomycetota bacterium]